MALHCFCHILFVRSEDYPWVWIPEAGIIRGPLGSCYYIVLSASVLMTTQPPLLIGRRGWNLGCDSWSKDKW